MSWRERAERMELSGLPLALAISAAMWVVMVAGLWALVQVGLW